MIELPIGWILGIIGSLAGVIATLSGILWSTMKSRLEAQDRIIDALQKDSDAKEVIIHGLQKDIERMSKGCGAGGCTWRTR